jgi:membrane-bound lytic murein transglycosylase A
LETFLKVLQSTQSPEELDTAIKQTFEVYQSVGCDDRGTVFFTGYYCPIFDGRRQPDSRFRFPLYRQPADLVKDGEGNALGRKMPNGQMVPYPTRREIEQGGMMRGQEIAWLKDPFEAYVVTVQGSAKLRLEDGSLYELGYSANNGHEYTSVGQALIKDGKLDKNKLSLQSLMQYFQSHPGDVPKYCWKNDRYVFFKEQHGGPYGSINVPVIPYRSIATDKTIFPRACLAYLQTSMPVISQGQVHQASFGSFALDQDTGGAIRAAGRCDIFVGIGEGAEAVAGRVGAEGQLYYLFVR